jgi:hypothetical protein
MGRKKLDAELDAFEKAPAPVDPAEWGPRFRKAISSKNEFVEPSGDPITKE